MDKPASLFLSPLISRKICEPKGPFGRAKFQLVEPLSFFSMEVCRIITAPAGFTTDFSSVPRLPLIYTLVGDTGHASAVIHDWMCVNQMYNWAKMAKIFKEALEVEGVPAWRRNLMYWGVRVGGVWR